MTQRRVARWDLKLLSTLLWASHHEKCCKNTYHLYPPVPQKHYESISRDGYCRVESVNYNKSEEKQKCWNWKLDPETRNNLQSKKIIVQYFQTKFYSFFGKPELRKTSKELFKSVKIFILGIFNTISEEIIKKIWFTSIRCWSRWSPMRELLCSP